MEHQIIRDHETNRSRGFGFIIFDSEEVVDEMLSNGNMIDMAGTQVRLFKVFPRKKNVKRSLLCCNMLYCIHFLFSCHTMVIFPHVCSLSFSISCSNIAVEIVTGIDLRKGLTLVCLLRNLG